MKTYRSPTAMKGVTLLELMIVLVIIVLVALGLLFEWAGGILDDGGTIGAWGSTLS